jgi:hypothetical protein
MTEIVERSLSKLYPKGPMGHQPHRLAGNQRQ